MEGRGDRGLYLMHISLHGLVRGYDMELGRDADTGGQITYVVELAKKLSSNPKIDRVDLLTRLVEGKGVDASYSEPFEKLGERSSIVRIRFGPRRYLRKEKLWPYLDTFVDQVLHHIRKVGRIPDIIHAHYADAGYAGAQLARTLGVPFLFTGHSLGRVKYGKLLDKGSSKESLEKRFHFSSRIEAEETALDTAARVIVSTTQEIDEQYSLYDNYQPERMKVIAPGVDLERFSPPTGGEWQTEIGEEIGKFLKDPQKPMVLAIARPDERKNFPTLIEAFAGNEYLRKNANLVLIAGNRDKLSELPPASRRVLRTMMMLIDQHDLYGSVAYPKHHESNDIPICYRIAASTKGVFVNPALTEPFGLTLIESAASGLPIIATDDGGPRDIIKACENGFLVDPLDAKKMGESIESGIRDAERWQEWSDGGMQRCVQTYSWDAHVTRYLEVVEDLSSRQPSTESVFDASGTRLPMVDRLLITKADETLTADSDALEVFLHRLRKAGNKVGFGVATGRRLTDVLITLRKHSIPLPDILITSAGTEIYYGKTLVLDPIWKSHINFRWKPDEIRAAMEELQGVSLQSDEHQATYKISYMLDEGSTLTKQKVKRHLRSRGIKANIIMSFGKFVDVLPIRASTGLAIRHLMLKWDLMASDILAVGTSGNEEQMLSGDTLGVVVGHFSPEIKFLEGRPRIFFTNKPHARGLLEGIEHYNFFGTIQLPPEEEIAVGEG